MAPWPSGKAKVCNTSIPGPIPGGASKMKEHPIGCSFVLSTLTLIRSGFCALVHKNRFANLTKGCSVLARELLGKFSSQSEPSGWRLQHGLTKKMPSQKPEVFSGFLHFSLFPHFFEIRVLVKIKKMPIGIFEQGSRIEPLTRRKMGMQVLLDTVKHDILYIF